MNYLPPPITQPLRSENTLGAHWPYTNKNNKRSLFARTIQQRASFNNDESSPQTQPPSLKAFHHSLDDGYGIVHQPKKVHVTSFRYEASNPLESTAVTSMSSQAVCTAPPLSVSCLTTTSTCATRMSGNSANTINISNHYMSLQ